MSDRAIGGNRITNARMDDDHVIDSGASRNGRGYAERDDDRAYADRDTREPQNIREFGTISVADFETAERQTRVTIELVGGKLATLNVTYDPSMVSDATSGLMQQMFDDDDQLAWSEVFCRTVLDWGLTGPLKATVMETDADGIIRRDDAGRPFMQKRIIVPAGERVPLEPEIVQHIRSDVLMGIWRKITEEVTGTGKAPRASRGKSRRR